MLWLLGLGVVILFGVFSLSYSKYPLAWILKLHIVSVLVVVVLMI